MLVAFTLVWGLAERQVLSTEITVIRGVITAEPAGSGGCATAPAPKKSFTDQDQLSPSSMTRREISILNVRHEIQIGQKLLNACAWIGVAGARAAQLPGQWTAKFSVDGVVKFQDTFTISATPTPSHHRLGLLVSD